MDAESADDLGSTKISENVSQDPHQDGHGAIQKTNSIDDLIENLCAKLDCRQLKYQIEKVNQAREKLVKTQNQEIFHRLMGTCENVMSGVCLGVQDQLIRLSRINESPTKEVSIPAPAEDVGPDELACEEEAMICTCPKKVGEVVELLPEDTWHGFFAGYRIVSEFDGFRMNDNMKCVQISYQTPSTAIVNYLRSGVRCILIDLFLASVDENQALVIRIRESELTVSEQIGFPVCCTICAMMCPRFQYIGHFDKHVKDLLLIEGEIVTLTGDRHWASRGTKELVYVNALYLIPDTKPCDILLVGSNIQLHVTEVFENRLECKVLKGGTLQPRMPVLFNKRCFRFRMSLEELEDLTFAKEIGINIVISYITGSQNYYRNLRECMTLLGCENMRLFGRVVLNKVDCECKKQYIWAAHDYDGFFFDLTLPEDRPYEQDILCIGEEISAFIERAYELMKPIIFDPILLVEKYFVVHPKHEYQIFHYPDKYLFKHGRKESSPSFYLLAQAISKPMTLEVITDRLPYCDRSQTGSNSLAMATVRASVEMDASCIFVLGHTGRMVTKISHFRPHVPIYFVTSMKSAEKFILVYNRVNMLYYHSDGCPEPYEDLVLKQFLLGIVCALSNKVLKDKDTVIFVYATKAGILFPDKYLIFKFKQNSFVDDLRQHLF